MSANLELEDANVLGETARSWIKLGYRCEVTTELDALRTWRNYLTDVPKAASS